MAAQLKDIDLNLLVALDVLLHECHITRAASRMHLSQPAMSQMLRRLRETFDDALLVRSRGRMVPTPLAEKLKVPLRAALQGLQLAISEPGGFDPGTAERLFRLAIFDHDATTLLPKVLSAIMAEAPGVKIEVVPLDLTEIRNQLRHGDVDLALMSFTQDKGDLMHQVLFEERMVSMVREDHPILHSPAPIDLQAFTSWPHATRRITRYPGTAIDRKLEELGTSRQVVVRFPYLLAAAALVASTDLIVTLPRACATLFVGSWPVALFEPPLPSMRYTFSSVYLATLHKDAGHVWLRGMIKRGAAALMERVQRCEIQHCNAAQCAPS